MNIIPSKEDNSSKVLFHNETVRKYFISDVLEIPVESIRRVQLTDPGLLRQYHNQKLGILDVMLEMNDDTKINIEIQLKKFQFWVKRQLYYLTKMYSADLMAGQNYGKLKRCIAICLLDYNISEREAYHSVYRLRDERGYEYSELLEIHIIELKKRLTGVSRMDEWIQLFNASSTEELDMLQVKTRNKGILEAIQEIRRMSLGRRVRAMYDAYLKAKRDEEAYEAALREEAIAQGLEIGRTKGLEQGLQEGLQEGLQQGLQEGLEQGRQINLIELIRIKLEKNKSIDTIAYELEMDVFMVERIAEIVLSDREKSARAIYKILISEKME